jgi:translation elongation factor P/translation initiation factor 5A
MSIAEVRKGDVLKHQDKYYIVQSITSSCSGRGVRIYNVRDYFIVDSLLPDSIYEDVTERCHIFFHDSFKTACF